MFGSIFTGLSGMNAFSNALRQISNNITNINSTGYKGSSLTFSGLFGTSSRDGGGGEGQGVSLQHPRFDFSQGELRQTDNDLDLAVDGGGFLVLLRDADRYFSRTGSFEVNEAGFIVLTGTEYKLTVLDENGAPKAVSVDGMRTSPPKATTTITLGDNLSSTSQNPFTLSNIKVFKEDGASENWSAKFERSATEPGQWTVTLSDASGAEIGSQTLKFIAGIVDPFTQQLTFTRPGQTNSVTLDFSHGVTSFSGLDSLRVSESDGYGRGDITKIAVNEAGELQIDYSNEQKKSLGAITLGNFRDPQTLDQQTGGIFTEGKGGGIEFLNTASERVGKVVSRRIEASNVDLSKEFGELILVQRGFQASSQVVSVSNDMIQQLFGIRGQG